MRLRLVVIGISAAVMLSAAACGRAKTEATVPAQIESQSAVSVSESEATAAKEITAEDNSAATFYRNKGNDDIYYTLGAHAEEFIINNEYLFPARSEAEINGSGLVASDVDYRGIYKNPDKYGDKLVFLSDVAVNKIREVQVDDSFISYLQLSNDDTNYYAIYRGSLNDIYDNDTISIYGLPIGTSQIYGDDKTAKEVIVLAASCIIKSEDGKASDAASSEQELVQPIVMPETQAEIPAEYKTMYVVNCTESISLRVSPSTQAQTIRQIPLGAAVSCISTAENGFYQISYLGDTGYALASYLSEYKPVYTEPVYNSNPEPM